MLFLVFLEGRELGFDAKRIVYRTNLGKIRYSLGGFSQIGRMSALSSAGET